MACTCGERVAGDEIAHVEMAVVDAAKRIGPDFQPASVRIGPVRTQHNIDGTAVPEVEETGRPSPPGRTLVVEIHVVRRTCAAP